MCPSYHSPVFSLISQSTENRAGFIRWQFNVCFLACASSKDCSDMLMICCKISPMSFCFLTSFSPPAFVPSSWPGIPYPCGAIIPPVCAIIRLGSSIMNLVGGSRLPSRQALFCSTGRNAKRGKTRFSTFQISQSSRRDCFINENLLRKKNPEKGRWYEVKSIRSLCANSVSRASPFDTTESYSTSHSHPRNQANKTRQMSINNLTCSAT